MDEPIIVVGGGMAGLTAAAYLSRTGHDVLLLEKEEKTGGLVNSFEHRGYTFDGGIRAIENSGIVHPMLRQLGIDVPMVRNGVSIGIEDSVADLRDMASLETYLDLLRSRFPGQSDGIARFGAAMRRIMRYMDVLYGIDNPLFLDLGADRQYLVKTFLPWLIRYLFTIPKVVRLDKPVMEYLQPILHDPSLIDMVAQHFFRGTPTFFALSYFSLYLDYQYPVGGTGALVDRMNRYILDHQGRIRCGVLVERIDPERRQVFTRDGTVFPYRKMIWCADQKKLYATIGTDDLTDGRTKRAVIRRRAFLEDKTGGDSILTVYAAVDKDPSWFAGISQAHFFYTPRKDGLGRLPDPAGIPVSGPEGGPHSAALEWIGRYLECTTYEISCPAMRDPRLAPAGRTGLVISTLFDYGLTRRIAEAGWYDEFKEICARRIVEVLDGTIYPGIRESVLETIVSPPMTLAGRTGNTDGAITGWAFTNRGMPAVHRMPQITKSIRTPIPDVYQAGQWSFSPSGLPISILTGKLAADRAVKDLKRSGKR